MALVLAAGAWLDSLPSPHAPHAPHAPQADHQAARPAPAAAPATAPVARADPRRSPGRHALQARQAEVRQRFDEAVVMLHARQYDHAVTALHRVLALAPEMPEAHVNMGFALLGMQRGKAARDFFDGAMALKPDQANAYYGLALAWEAEGDLHLATGAMRSYLHLARSESEAHLRRARAALWEWETRLDAGRPSPVVSASASAPASASVPPPTAR